MCYYDEKFSLVSSSNWKESLMLSTHDVALRLVLSAIICSAAPALDLYAQVESSLYAFPGNSGGAKPVQSLAVDSAGDLFSTTFSGGKHGAGTAFMLTPSGGGGYVETDVADFTGTYGSNPVGGLVIDSSGNFYGTAQIGGHASHGTAFRLSPVAGGGYKPTVLHSFTGGSDGGYPDAPLTLDLSGNLFGTAMLGGNVSGLCASTGASGGCGTVYQLTPQSNGTFKFSTLYQFKGGADGSNPAYYGQLVLDNTGNIYGVTTYGGTSVNCGSYGCGTVFMLSPTAGGHYRKQTLYSFLGVGGSSLDGWGPLGRLLIDKAGVLYGTTYYGGNGPCTAGSVVGCGTVFSLSKSGGGWKETVLYSFLGEPDASLPYGGFVFDSVGNIFGTAGGGAGCIQGCGTVYELSPNGSGSWSESVIYRFQGGLDGSSPDALTPDGMGGFYGLTGAGGQASGDGFGTVFHLVP